MQPKEENNSLQFENKLLWKNFKSGDRSSFEKIYRKYFPELYSYGMTLAPNKGLIKDAIQELFVDLWRYRSNLSDVDKLWFYLRKSLRSKIFKHLDQVKKSYEVQSQLVLEVEMLPSQEALIINDQDQECKIQKLKLVINELSPRQREAIMLIFFEERTYEEVSTLLSISVQSVYTLVWKSIASLRKRMNT